MDTVCEEKLLLYVKCLYKMFGSNHFIAITHNQNAEGKKNHFVWSKLFNFLNSKNWESTVIFYCL